MDINILIVDDDEAYAGILQLKLEQEGYKVTYVSDGGKALAKASELLPDVILLDLIMPDHDGFDVLRDLKTHEKTSHIPVFVFSNLGEESDIKKVMDLGAKKYLVKSDVSVIDVVAEVKAQITQPSNEQPTT